MSVKHRPRVVSASFFLLFTDCSWFSAMLMPCSSSLCRNDSRLKSVLTGKHAVISPGLGTVNDCNEPHIAIFLRMH